MPNLYARLSDVMAKVAGQSYAHTATGLSEYLRETERVSRAVESWTNRHFYALSATRYFAWRGIPKDDARRLRLGADLASITSVLVDDDDDDTYELTLVEGTDYYAEPENRLPNTPIESLYLIRSGTKLYGWPRHTRAVKVTGLWGYSYELEATTATLNGNINAGATSLTLSSGLVVDVGETIVIDSEQFYVSAISGAVATVAGAQNGTTAAAHTTGATVYRRRYPADLEQAVMDQVARQKRRQADGWEDVGQTASVYTSPGWAQIRDTLDHYRQPVVA